MSPRSLRTPCECPVVREEVAGRQVAAGSLGAQRVRGLPEEHLLTGDIAAVVVACDSSLEGEQRVVARVGDTPGQDVLAHPPSVCLLDRGDGGNCRGPVFQGVCPGAAQVGVAGAVAEKDELDRDRAVVLEREDVGEPSGRSEEHTSELQSRGHLVCRLLLEKKKKK